VGGEGGNCTTKTRASIEKWAEAEDQGLQMKERSGKEPNESSPGFTCGAWRSKQAMLVSRKKEKGRGFCFEKPPEKQNGRAGGNEHKSTHDERNSREHSLRKKTCFPRVTSHKKSQVGFSVESSIGVFNFGDRDPVLKRSKANTWSWGKKDYGGEP